MWRAITYVTSGLTLVAFIVAIGAVLVKRSLAQKERQIRLAPGEQRAELIERALEFFSIDTANLNSNQQYRLAVEQIHARGVRFKTTAVVVTIIAVLTAGLTAFAIWQEKKSLPQIDNPRAVPPATEPSPEKVVVPTSSVSPPPTPTPADQASPPIVKHVWRPSNTNNNQNTNERLRQKALDALNGNTSPSP